MTPEQLVDGSGRSFNSMWRCADGTLDTEELSAALREQAEAGGPAFNPRRCFVEAEFIIHSGDKTWALTKMWGANTEEIMMNWISTYPDAGIKVSRSS